MLHEQQYLTFNKHQNREERNMGKKQTSNNIYMYYVSVHQLENKRGNSFLLNYLENMKAVLKKEFQKALSRRICNIQVTPTYTLLEYHPQSSIEKLPSILYLNDIAHGTKHLEQQYK